MGSRFECNLCDKWFNTLTKLRAHAEQGHPTDIEGALGGAVPESVSSPTEGGVADNEYAEFLEVLRDTSIGARRNAIGRIFFNGDTRSVSWLMQVLNDARINEFDRKLVAEMWFKKPWDAIERDLRLEAQASGQPMPKVPGVEKGPSDLKQMTDDFREAKDLMRESMQMRAMQNMMGMWNPASPAVPDPTKALQPTEKRITVVVGGSPVEMTPEAAVAYKQWEAEERRRDREAEEKREERRLEAEERKREREEERRRQEKADAVRPAEEKKPRILVDGTTADMADSAYAAYTVAMAAAKAAGGQNTQDSVRDMVQSLRDEMHKREIQAAEERRQYEARLASIQRDQQMDKMNEEVRRLQAMVQNRNDGLTEYLETKARLQGQGLESTPIEEKKLAIEGTKVEKSLELAERALAGAQGKGDRVIDFAGKVLERGLQHELRQNNPPPAPRDGRSRHYQEEPTPQDVYDAPAAPVVTREGSVVLPTNYNVEPEEHAES